MKTLQEYITGATSFIGDALLPALFALALLFFVWNAFKFFILEADNKDAKDKARTMAIYGIGAFVFLVSIWGIVNMIISGFNLKQDSAIQSDYFNSSNGARQQNGNNPSPFPQR